MDLSKKVLGQRLFEKLMKMTFYGQFVAGEDQNTIKPLIEKNQAFGVGSVLDYSVEEDLTQEEAEKKEMEWVWTQDLVFLSSVLHREQKMHDIEFQPEFWLVSATESMSHSVETVSHYLLPHWSVSAKAHHLIGWKRKVFYPPPSQNAVTWGWASKPRPACWVTQSLSGAVDIWRCGADSQNDKKHCLDEVHSLFRNTFWAASSIHFF